MTANAVIFRVQMLAKHIRAKLGDDQILGVGTISMISAVIVTFVAACTVFNNLEFDLVRPQAWVDKFNALLLPVMEKTLIQALPASICAMLLIMVLQGAVRILSDLPVARAYHDHLARQAEAGCAASAFELYRVAKREGVSQNEMIWLARARDLGHKLAIESEKI